MDREGLANFVAQCAEDVYYLQAMHAIAGIGDEEFVKADDSELVDYLKKLSNEIRHGEVGARLVA